MAHSAEYDFGCIHNFVMTFKLDWELLLSEKRSPLQTTAVAPEKKTSLEQPDIRTPFERDYDRVIFSTPFRRLARKTQVHPFAEMDQIHNRLTHTLEVASVGRSLAYALGRLIDARKELPAGRSIEDIICIVQAACLAHDIGNPPFGHAGEFAIREWVKENATDLFGAEMANKSQGVARDWRFFEGNAQGFRILNKSQYGLKLTLATLGAFTKYPCPAFFPQRDKSKRSQKKFGFFETEEELFGEVASSLGLIRSEKSVWCRHPLAFLVEAADDICYSIIDLEDGCRLGLIGFEETVALLAPILQAKLDRTKLTKRSGLNEKLGILRAMAIGELIEAATMVFLDHEQAMLDGAFDQALMDLCEFSKSIKAIGDVSERKIYHARKVVEIEAAGHEVLPGLMHEFIQAAIQLSQVGGARKYRNLGMLLPEETQREIQQHSDDLYQLLRHCIDFISGMTDRHAISLYRKIKGISLT